MGDYAKNVYGNYLMLTSPKKPEPGIQAGKFGRSGKMIIPPFSISEGDRDKVLKVFLKFVTISICGCWEWQGRTHNGYPCFSYPGGSTKWAHRVSYALFNGPIKAQMHVDHKCRNRICVNPGHLKQMTPTENYLAIGRRKRRDERLMKEAAGQLTLWG